MSHSSTSVFKGITTRHLLRDVLRVLLVLVALELVVRFEPINSWLRGRLDPYANLLWYSDYMPSYQDQLTNGPHHDFWLVGSSYIMTSLNPASIQKTVQDQGFQGMTFQNFGLSGMRNLADMAEVYDRWMFQQDKPRYILMAISINNFAGGSYAPSVARNSPMENAVVFPDSLDDYIAGFLFNNSKLFRYTLLARNATFVPFENARLIQRPLGGYIEDPLEFVSCQSTSWVEEDNPKFQYSVSQFERMDTFIKVIQARQIPLIVVNIPFNYCGLRQFFASYENYENAYLKPMAEHLQQLGIPFYPLDTDFYATVPEDVQYQYYEDTAHPNQKGSILMSQWTADFIVSWLEQLKDNPN